MADKSFTSVAEKDHLDIPAIEVLKRFISYYGPYKSLFFFDLFCATVLACIDLAFPQLLNFFTKEFFLEDAQVILASLGLILLLFVVLYSARTACQWFITSWGHIMGARMEADMRRDLFESYQRLSFSYFDTHSTGAMMSRISNDLFDISELAHHGPENLFICTLKIIGSFILLAFMSLPLTLMMLLATVAMAAFSFWRNYVRRIIFRENRERMAGINSRVQDSLEGIRVVQSFSGEDVEKRRFGRENEAFLDTKNRSYRFMGSFHAANSAFMGVLYTICVVGGGYFVATGQMPVTDLAIFALYIGIFISPVEQLVNFTETFQKGYAGFRRFVEVIEEDPDVKSLKGAPTLTAACGGDVRGAVKFDDVVFGYDENAPVLKGLSLEIPAGGSLALVGPSGGGKTTTCSLLPRFYDPQSGVVSIDGIDVKTVELSSLRESIGIVQQDVYLFANTIKENIAYGRPDATMEEIVDAAKKANIHDFVMSLPDGYDTMVGERGARLSGGQKQRVAIARVFLRSPRILILDEATSALDNESEIAIQESIEELARGRTTLMIAHRLSTIRKAERIAVIEDGRVSELGTHEELLAAGGTFARYYKMQFGD